MSFFKSLFGLSSSPTPNIDFTDDEARAVEAAFQPLAGKYIHPKAKAGLAAVALWEYSMEIVRINMYEFTPIHGGASLAAKLALQKAFSSISKAYNIYPLPVFFFYQAGIFRLLGQEQEAKPMFARFLELQSRFTPDNIDEMVLGQVCSDMQSAISEAQY